MSSSSSSSWGSKLQVKLATINESSSRESIQAVAKWIAFNRKHSDDICKSLLHTKDKPIVSIIHEVLQQEVGSAKWVRLESLRHGLGDVLLQIVPGLDAAGKEHLQQDYLPIWDDIGAFSGTTILSQIKRVLLHDATATEDKAPLHEAKQSVNNEVEAKKPVRVEDELVGKLEATEVKPEAAIIKEAQQAEYDFERGIPAERVDPKEFLEPSRSIASLQIARDVRNDAAIQLSSRLAAVPEDIRQALSQENLSEAQAQNFALRIDPALIDADLEDEVQNVQTLRDLIQRQRHARAHLWHMLVRSRCQFGANEAAHAFLQAYRSKEDLIVRKQILMDAMELEGLDIENADSTKNPEQELAPLLWYKASTEEDAKRQRIE